jgi:NAD(P)-dependent dehydrogenase (short-subunit alcohol dehydrogenase family)
MAFALEYAPKVRVNAIAAGAFLTDVSKHWTDEQRASRPSAIGHPGRPEEIVTSALYLASDASSFTTGTVLRVDGGLI